MQKKTFTYTRNFSAALIVSTLAAARLSAQQIIKGIIIDRDTRNPVEQATVTDSTSGTSVYSGITGKFVLRTLSENGVVITVSCIGYASVKDTISNSETVTIELHKSDVRLKDVVITSSRNPLYSTQILSTLDLNAHPAKSAQDLLRLVPGLFVAQHQGGGKAEGIALRGFDADHGTDVNISVDGMPVNLPAHAHGQGYADLHFLIPELIGTYDWGKGPYYTSKGDFTTAGFVNYNTKDFLDRNFVKLEGGRFTTGRFAGAVNLLSNKARTNGQSFYIAGDATYTNGGPFTQVPEHFKRYNLFGKMVTPLGEKNTLVAEASTLWSKWRSSGEIPERAVAEGYIDGRWGALDSFQTGYTTRTNAIIKLKTELSNHLTWNNEAFYSNYFLNLYTNFSFYYFFPADGDEFRQYENRNLFGYYSTLSQINYAGNTSFNTNYGAGFRTDLISPIGLDHTKDGAFLENIELGKGHETNVYGFIDENIRHGNWLFNIGLRYDYFDFYYLNRATDTIATHIFGG